MRSSLTKYKTIKTLKEAMLEFLEGDDDEEEEEEAPVKAKAKEKTKKAPPKEKKEKTETNQALAARLLEEEAGTKEINAAFKKVYEAKGVDDMDFIKKRAGIYMKIAKDAAK